MSTMKRLLELELNTHETSQSLSSHFHSRQQRMTHGTATLTMDRWVKVTSGELSSLSGWNDGQWLTGHLDVINIERLAERLKNYELQSFILKHINEIVSFHLYVIDSYKKLVLNFDQIKLYLHDKSWYTVGTLWSHIRDHLQLVINNLP